MGNFETMHFRNVKNAAQALAVTILLHTMIAGPAMADATQTFSKFTEGSTKTIDHSVWDALLKKYVVAGPDELNRVRYQAFKSNDHPVLKEYVASLEAVSPETLGRPEQFAYWANLYNAKTIDVVLDAYPVKSIREITPNAGLFDLLKKSVGAGGPWKAKIMRVAGEDLSLDDVEHNILRPIFKDPRVHYAVNCASVGCPNLQRAAFTGQTLEPQLNAGAKAYINSSRGFDVKNGSITASSIYSWFQVDFGGNAVGVRRHAIPFAEPGLKAKLAAATTIDAYAYDWSLNDAQ